METKKQNLNLEQEFFAQAISIFQNDLEHLIDHFIYQDIDFIDNCNVESLNSIVNELTEFIERYKEI